MISSKNQEIPVMIRILPMNKFDEWKDWGISEIQREFLLKELNTERQGKYHYKTAGMKVESGSIVLFQFDNKIIGLANLDEIKKRDDPGYFDIPTKLDNEPEYKGAYYFEPHSIRTFKPISAGEMKRLWAKEFIDRNGDKHPAFVKFGEAKQFLDPEKYPDFCRILEDIEEPENT